jgi:hypothetical protein
MDETAADEHRSTLSGAQRGLYDVDYSSSTAASAMSQLEVHASAASSSNRHSRGFASLAIFSVDSQGLLSEPVRATPCDSEA